MFIQDFKNIIMSMIEIQTLNFNAKDIKCYVVNGEALFRSKDVCSYIRVY